MPFRREILLEADPATTYDALREVVAPNLESDLFEITVDEPDVEFGIAYVHFISSSHYRFSIEELEEGTRLEAQLWLGGLVGPFQSMLRFWSHNRHLEKILDGVEQKSIAILEQDAAFDDVDLADPELQEDDPDPEESELDETSPVVADHGHIDPDVADRGHDDPDGADTIASSDAAGLAPPESRAAGEEG